MQVHGLSKHGCLRNVLIDQHGAFLTPRSAQERDVLLPIRSNTHSQDADR
jgi:hypothetical protein